MKHIWKAILWSWFNLSIAKFASNFNTQSQIFPAEGVAPNAVAGIPKRAPLGPGNVVLFQLNVTNYVTGGVIFQPSDFGFRLLFAAVPVCAQGGGYTLVLNAAGNGFQIFQSAAVGGQHAEVAQGVVNINIIILAVGVV